MEKTGGTSIMTWIRPRVDHAFHYGRTHCYFSLEHHVDLFPEFAYARKLRRCRFAIDNDSAVAVEFHSWSKERFWSVLAPRMAALRARHAARGGKFVAVTLLRVPRMHILSTYIMWPPVRRSNRQTAKEVVPFDEWAHSSGSGLQTSLITLQPGCSTQMALERLRTFDMVCELHNITRVTRYVVDVCKLGKYGNVPLPWIRHQGGTPGIKRNLIRNELRHINEHTISRAAECDNLLFPPHC